MSSHANGWTEVGDGVFVRRYEPVDVSVGAIVGPTGVTIVDTRNSPEEGDEILRDVVAEFRRPVVAAINTHAHYDHTFGNERFAAHGVGIYGHVLVPRHFEQHEAPRLAAVQADPSREPDKSWAGVHLTPPTVLVDAPFTIDPGERMIELLPIEPGHTDTDLAVHVPDAGVWFLGDVLEESGAPMFGSGSFPLGWPAALRSVLGRVGADEAIVPGHGAVVDRAFGERQADQLEAVAAFIRSSYAGSGADSGSAALPAELLALWPESSLRSALRAGYAALAAER
ncbi:MBL fold metallo-hydrolase [Herbiconiux sp. VKM Ac-2851]|uniref:MBL fold metallo-hydrolase n=1 Tax=Herbiconiux sp. VKM Ac-2851 TaxID=2739025 RepID=UPI001565DE31|nr:MBL fold metallo-hydrolase [Herbiconiux sp. VKM Ac-2851]NQX35033.1 MBL fold metallo-hydrolase [Herbiconiux sp. VKM Ac-2851]